MELLIWREQLRRIFIDNWGMGRRVTTCPGSVESCPLGLCGDSGGGFQTPPLKLLHKIQDGIQSIYTLSFTHLRNLFIFKNHTVYMNDKSKPRICFEITDDQRKRALKTIPRSFNLSEKLRSALDKVMDGLETEKEE